MIGNHVCFDLENFKLWLRNRFINCIYDAREAVKFISCIHNAKNEDELRSFFDCKMILLGFTYSYEDCKKDYLDRCELLQVAYSYNFGLDWFGKDKYDFFDRCIFYWFRTHGIVKLCDRILLSIKRYHSDFNFISSVVDYELGRLRSKIRTDFKNFQTVGGKQIEKK